MKLGWREVCICNAPAQQLTSEGHRCYRNISSITADEAGGGVGLFIDQKGLWNVMYHT